MPELKIKINQKDTKHGKGKNNSKKEKKDNLRKAEKEKIKVSQKQLRIDAKYKRQRELGAARQRKCKANMSEERLEAKRKRDRERYYGLKKAEKIKHIKNMSEKEKEQVRKEWKKKKAAYRKKKNEDNELLQNTIQTFDLDEMDLLPDISRLKDVGRKKVCRERSKGYRDYEKVNKENEILKREVAKLRKMLSQEKKKEKKTNENVASLTPMKKLEHVVRDEKVSPQTRRSLFLGFCPEKQIKVSIKRVKSEGKDLH